MQTGSFDRKTINMYSLKKLQASGSFFQPFTWFLLWVHINNNTDYI